MAARSAGLAAVILLVLTTGAAAQRRDSTPAPLPPRVSATQAAALALERVRQDLQFGLVDGWSPHLGGKLLVASSEERVRGGRALYVVAVACPGARGHVRVLLDALSGDVLSAVYRRHSWFDAPAWWVAGLDGPPR